MKKLCLFIMLCCMSFNVNAQIQREFFGLTIGVATQQQVEDVMKNMGKEILSKTEGLKVNDVRFYDYDWAEVLFNFREGKLITVSFISKNNDKTKSDAYAEQFKKSLKEQYGKYCKLDMGNIVAYFDTKTMLTIVCQEKDGKEMFGILYADGGQISDMMKKVKSEK